MVPAIVTFMPLFVLVSNLDLVNTHAGLILPFLAGAFGVFLMRQFIGGIPDELLDAARIDGAGEYTIFFRIVLPLCGPALATLAVLTFLASWNAFLWPLVVASTEDMYTLPVAIALFSIGQQESNVALQMAGAVVVVLPVSSCSSPCSATSSRASPRRASSDAERDHADDRSDATLLSPLRGDRRAGDRRRSRRLATPAAPREPRTGAGRARSNGTPPTRGARSTRSSSRDTGLPADNIGGDLRPSSRSDVHVADQHRDVPVGDARRPRPRHRSADREARRRIDQTLSSIERLERHEPSGQFYNWYDPATLEKLTIVAGERTTPSTRSCRASTTDGWPRRCSWSPTPYPVCTTGRRRWPTSMDFGCYYDPMAKGGRRPG